MSLQGVTKNFIHPYSLSESSSIRISINGAAALVHCFLRRSGAPACHSSGVTGSQVSWKQSQMAGPQPAHIQQVHERQELGPAVPHKPPQQHAFPSPLSPLSPPGMRLAPKVFSYPLLESTPLSTGGGSLMKLLHAAHRLQPLRNWPSGEGVDPAGQLLLAAAGRLCGSCVWVQNMVHEGGRQCSSQQKITLHNCVFGYCSVQNSSGEKGTSVPGGSKLHVSQQCTLAASPGK